MNKEKLNDKEKKRLFANIRLYGLLFALLVVVIISLNITRDKKVKASEESYEYITPDKIYFKDSKVEVDFSQVILSKQNETRLLKISEQRATVSTKLTDRLIKGVDWNVFKKTQNVSYEGCGSFVVDLNNIRRSWIVNDKEKKILTIKIDHARLDTIVVDPNKIIVDEVNTGLLNWGKIDLTVADYTKIEKEIQKRLEDKFNTAENAQKADDIAKKMVKETYEPVVQAIDPEYTVVIEFAEPLKKGAY